MIYVCVPVHNEARTVGLVLWKVRQVFTTFPREYHLLVCDDASTDGTAQVLATYAKVLPMSTVTHRERHGYARSLEELLRLALQRTDRPKRDCAITLHADFSHPPDVMVEMVRRLESGSDVIIAEMADDGTHGPRVMRWVRRWAPRLLRVPGVRDTVSGYLALRLIVWRQTQRGDGTPILTTDGWSANAELLTRILPNARRTETIAAPVRHDLAQRPPRTTPWRQLMGVWRSRAVIRAARTTTALLLMCLLPRFGGAQADTTPATLPFAVGERLVYSARLGVFSVGEATLEVAGLDTVRGVESLHFRFHIEGGALWYHLDQTLESWVGREDFRSRRFLNRTEEKKRRWQREFNIFPDSGFYREAGRDSTHPTVAEPLDDAAFLYWIRTVPLKIGERYEFQRYFRMERNPVIVEVLGREKLNVAGRKWDAIILRPTIPNGGGIFAEKAEARLWLSDDSARIVLGLQSKFSFGHMTMKLKEYTGSGHP